MLDKDGSKRPEIDEVVDFCRQLGEDFGIRQQSNSKGKVDSASAIPKLEISNPAEVEIQNSAEIAGEDVCPATAESSKADKVIEGVDLFETIENVLESAKPHGLLVPETRLLHKHYELRKEPRWTRIEEKPFDLWVLELRAVKPEKLKRLVVDEGIFQLTSELMEHLRPVVEDAKFLLIKMKLAGRPASSSALAIYQNLPVGTAKSLCVRADECAKLFDLDPTHIKNFLRRHTNNARKRKVKGGSNWLINRAMPSQTKETLIEFASKILHDIRIPYRHTNYQAWVRLELLECFLRDYDDYSKSQTIK
ncbi:hypothetical protein BKA69DRAFT_348119 [Paraphysoderma sedebokerense]|nr:hypothetical protein BKA69DRAFT_348119 [Paraphysoderma sedebokerense]